MKKLLSDQGTEFLNNLIEEFLKLNNVEKRTTSSYHPACNGKNEKTNGVLTRALRKHAELDPSNWDLMLEFVTIAYNTREHSITGVAPYTGVFGLVCNHFDSYINDESTQRNRENNIRRIQNLFENIQEEVKVNRCEYQTRQKKIQDNNHQVTNKPFEIGQLVTIKSLKIQNKLQPKYNGIFKIVEITSHGNYKLENENGEILRNSYFHSRLKPVNNEIDLEEEEHCEVEKILKHRTRNKTLQYLVKWMNSDEQTWEPEYHFDTREVIDEYWESINKPKPNSALFCLNKFKQALSLFALSPTIFLLLFCVCSIDAHTIKGNFKLCDITSKENWDLPESCSISNQKPQVQNNNYYVISK